MANTRRRFFRRILATVALPLAMAGAWIGWNRANNNFATVRPNQVYRSGQMSASTLARTLHDSGIQTVLNLRGANGHLGWYRAERAATLAAGATQVDVSLSSCVWMSRAQLRTLIEVLDSSRYPMLIHCEWGAERTGLVSAFVELLREGSTIDDARNQFALKYLYLPFGDGKIMAEMIDQYDGWLRRRELEHRPELFRRWAANGYQPGSPNREEWPWDPYPLIVTTRPPAEQMARSAEESARR